jgi:peptide deformylase
VPTRYSIITIDPDDVRSGKNLALRAVSHEVDPLSPDTQRVIAGLFDLLENGPQKGVGLAAPQVGILSRIFVVNIKALRKPAYTDPDAPSITDEPPLHDPTPLRMAVVNPVFSELSEDKVKDYEACLSIPGYRGAVPRHHRLRVQAFNEHGEAIDMIVEGFVARVFQHEYDHLEGILYLDRMDSKNPLEIPPPPDPVVINVVIDN